MFDIGFAELLIIGVVGLLVIGPDRLPEAIRTAALWFGRSKRTISRVREEFEEQIGADEIRRELRNETIMEDLKKAEEEFGEFKDNFTDNLDFEESNNNSKKQPQQTPLPTPETEQKTKSENHE